MRYNNDQLMMSLIFFLLPLPTLSRHIGELLCRKCGASITRQSELMNTTGANNIIYHYDFPVVGKNLTINVFKNPAGEKFHVLGAKTAHLKFHGQASSDSSWYEGMQWTVCLCKACSQHLGWYFQPLEPSAPRFEQRSFVGLVLDYLISADYVDTLTKLPNA